MVNWSIVDIAAFASVGAQQIFRGESDDFVLNFGIAEPDPSVIETQPIQVYPDYSKAFPQEQGRWDGRTEINLAYPLFKVRNGWKTVIKQKIGTCGGVSVRKLTEYAQCAAIFAGSNLKFTPVSHAWPYYLARREWNMLGRGDGVPGGSTPEMMVRFGMVTAEEANDLYGDGPNVDDVAKRWGAGNIQGNEVDRLTAIASDNRWDCVVARTIQELCDGMLNNWFPIQSDSMGFSLDRDQEGISERQGQWAHYHGWLGVYKSQLHEKMALVYSNSWGFDMYRGSAPPGFPLCCHGTVDFDYVESSLRTGKCHLLRRADWWRNTELDWMIVT